MDLKDSTKLVDRQRDNKRYDSQYEFAGQSKIIAYKTGFSRDCCQLNDSAALRCIIVWMCTVAVVVFVALVAEIVSQENTIKVGDIVTDHPNCSQIGSRILAQGGNAVDAAVAAAFCLAVALPHLAGLGGGGVLILHQTRTKKTTVVDFREISPLNLNINRYLSNPGMGERGRGSVATPGFLAGLNYARQKYGSHEVRLECCNWYDLIHPTLQLLDTGVALPFDWANLTADSTLLSEEVKQLVAEGAYSRISSKYRKDMRDMMASVAHDPETFYSGTQRWYTDLKDQVTKEDLLNYRVEERAPLNSSYNRYELYTPPPPFSGAGLIGILNSLAFGDNEKQTATQDQQERLATLINIIESVMAAQEQLGDPAQEDLQDPEEELTQDTKGDDVRYQGESGQTISIAEKTEFITNKRNAPNWKSPRQRYGTPTKSGNSLAEGTSIVVMDSQDNYVSLVLSLGSPFGSQVFSKGILMNNALASFDIPDGESYTESGNFIKQGIRPLSYSAPAILVDQKEPCGTRVVLGSLSPVAAAQILHPILSGESSDFLNLVTKPRILHRNHTISAERGYRKEELKDADIQKSAFVGHSVNTLEKLSNRVTGVADNRGGHVQGRWKNLEPKFKSN